MADLPNISLNLYAQTDVGMVRSGNEDNFLVLDLTTGASWTASDPTNQNLVKFSQGYYGSLLAVSDGMGGALAGEVASRLAVETVRDRMLQLQAHSVYSQIPFAERLRIAIEEANLLINGESAANPEHKGLGATFTAAAIQGNRVFFGQVGDSRAYLLRQGKIIRITKDQSLVQQLIDAGQITEEEAETHSYRNVILQALGAHGSVNVEINALKLCVGDTLVLCSDGLSGKVRADEIARLIQASADLNAACQSLIALANERGGEDNITVVAVQFSGSGLPATISDTVEPENLARQPDTPTELRWEDAAATDQLSNSGPTEKLGGTAPAATEPLPTPPPSLFSPRTAETPRTPAKPDRPSRAEGRDRAITSVFSIDKYAEDEQVVTAFEGGNSSGQDAIPVQNAAITAPAPAQAPEPAVTEATRVEAVEPAKGFNQSRFVRGLLATLAMAGVVAAVLGTLWYLNVQEQKRKSETALKEQQRRNLEQSDRKQYLIDDLKNQLDTVERDFRAADTSKNKQKWRRISDDLFKVNEKFDHVKSTPANQLADIEEEGKEIQKALRKLKDDIKDLQGLVPVDRNSTEPVSC